ncbi:MAG: hypothetical protein K6C14_03240, partial [Eubacterium sp.]|nr:hypothetical protein [Eubacterium sp.]
MKKLLILPLCISVLFASLFNVSSAFAQESVQSDFLYGYSLCQSVSTGTITETSFGYGTRIKAPKTDVTRVEMLIHVSEDSDVTCTVRSSDLQTVYASAVNHVTADERNTVFTFDGAESISEDEIYICVEADSAVLGNDMLRSSNDGYGLNPEIGAAYGNYSNKTVNVYKQSATQWKWRYTSQANRYSLVFYIYCKADETAVKHHDIYVSPDGSDTDGDGSESNPYATLIYANDTISDSSYYNQYTIHVADGFYDDLSYAEDSDVNQAILLKNYVTYEGNVEHPENCVIYYDGALRPYNHEITSDDLTAKKSVFHYVTKDIKTNLGITTTVRGFKLSGKNIRYFIHLDTSGRGVGGDYTFSNLIINHLGCPY